MSFERIWYELSPYAYIVAAIAVLLGIDGLLGQLSAIALLVAAGVIVGMRIAHRHPPLDPRARSATAASSSSSARASRSARASNPARASASRKSLPN